MRRPYSLIVLVAVSMMACNVVSYRLLYRTCSRTANILNSKYFPRATLSGFGKAAPLIRRTPGTMLFSTKVDEVPNKPPNKPMSLADKATELWNNYGYVAVGTYLGVYITTLGSIFAGLDNDILNAGAFGLDPNHAVQKVCDIVESITGYTSFPDYIRSHPQLGTLAIAWVMTKFTEPVRIVFTLSIVPKIASVIGVKSKSVV